MKIARFVSFLSTVLFLLLTILLLVYYNLDKSFLKSFANFFTTLKENGFVSEIFKMIDEAVLNYKNVFKYGSLIFGLFHIVLSSSAFSTFKRNDVPNEYLAFGILNILTLNIILGIVSLMSVPKAKKNKKQKEELADEEFNKKLLIQGILAANGKTLDECTYIDKNGKVSSLKNPTPANYNLPVLPKHNNKAFIWLTLLLGATIVAFCFVGAYAIFGVIIALMLFYDSFCGKTFYKRTLNKAKRILSSTNASIDEVRHMMKNINIINQGYDKSGRYIVAYANNKSGFFFKKDYEGLTCVFINDRLTSVERNYRRTTYYYQ